MKHQGGLHSCPYNSFAYMFSCLVGFGVFSTVVLKHGWKSLLWESRLCKSWPSEMSCFFGSLMKCFHSANAALVSIGVTLWLSQRLCRCKWCQSLKPMRLCSWSEDLNLAVLAVPFLLCCAVWLTQASDWTGIQVPTPFLRCSSTGLCYSDTQGCR